MVEKGEIAPACARFAESQRRDPQLGTLLYLATCHEQEGKTATAWVEFKEALAQAEQANKPDRVEQAKQGVARVEPNLARIRLVVREPAGGQTVKLPVRQSTGRSSRGGSSSQPSRQPVIEKYFENELTTIASRLAAHAQAVDGASG